MDVRVSLQRFIFGDVLRNCNRGCIDTDHASGHDFLHLRTHPHARTCLPLHFTNCLGLLVLCHFGSFLFSWTDRDGQSWALAYPFGGASLMHWVCSRTSVCPMILPAAGWFRPSRLPCFPISQGLNLLGFLIVCQCCRVLRISLIVIQKDGCADGCPPMESLTLFWALQPLWRHFNHRSFLFVCRHRR